MESSSENSFAWTDTSSDSFDSNSMAPGGISEKSDDNTELNNYHGKKRKKKSLSEISSNLYEDKEHKIKEEQSYYEMKNNSINIKKKKIKLEPESDNDLFKRKKKTNHIELNGNQLNSQDSGPYDETYLNMKVKQEESYVSSSTKQKQKKRKHHLSIDTNDSTSAQLKTLKNNHSSATDDENITLKQENEYEMGRKAKKKKRHCKKRYDSDDNNLEIEDNMDIEESVLNKQEQSNEILSKIDIVNHTETYLRESNTFQENSEESGCDEISAIKCDDDPTCNDSLTQNTLNRNHKLAKNSLSGQDLNENSVAVTHRTPRISDRIRFEDEEDANTESSQVLESDCENNIKSAKLKQFIQANPKLKQLSQKFYKNLSLAQDDEIWILKCPKEIDIKAFNNASLNIYGKCKIKIGGQSYDGSAEDEQSDTIALLTMEYNKYQIKNLPLSGIIHLRKRIPKAHFREDNIMINNQTNFIPLPETKCRHPLFGTNYKKALKIPAAIAERLNVQDSEESSMKVEKKKKKKNKRDKNTSEEVVSQVQSDFIVKSEPYLTVEVNEKKKKKRKIVNDVGPTPKKAKRIKHDLESAEAWESEKAIEENLFNF